MRVIIGGAGEVGRGVANALRQEKRSVALIDPKPSAINESQSIDSLLVTGSVLSRDSLLRAGISDAEIIVMATNNDEINLLACAFAKRVYSEQVGDRNAAGLTAIAVISNPNLMNTDRGAGPLERWSRADHIVCSSDEIVEQLAAGLLAPSIDEILAFGDKSWISAVEVTSKSALIGVKTGEVSNIFVDIPSIYAISTGEEGGRLTDGSEIIKEGDILVFVSRSTSQFSQITKAVGRVDPELPEKPQVAIFGAGRVGVRLANARLVSGAQVTVVERELEKSNNLAGSDIGNMKGIEIIHGDHLDKNLLSEIEIGSHDIAISALNDDHASIAAVLLAIDMGVERTGLILYDADLVNVVRRMGITFSVDRKRVAIDSILARIHSELPGPYAVLSSVPDVIGICLPVNADVKFAGKTILDAGLPEWCKVAFIQRKNIHDEWETMRPSSSKTLLEGDRLTIFLPPDRVDDLEKKFKV